MVRATACRVIHKAAALGAHLTNGAEMRISSKKLVMGLLGACVALGFGQAQATPVKGKIFDDWSVECVGEKKDEKCYITQTLTMKEGGGRLLKVSVGYLGPKGEPVMVGIFPLGIWLPAGAAFKLDDQPQTPMVLQQCTSEGCVGSLPLTSAMIKSLQDGKSLLFGILPAGTQKTLSIAASLKGFKAAFASLK
jgi:invasion protein IalB